MQTNRTWGKMVTIAVGKGQGGVVDWATAGRNKQGEESSHHQWDRHRWRSF